MWFHSTTAIIGEARSRLAGPFVHFEWMRNRLKVPHTFKLELHASDWSAPCCSHFPLVRTDEDDVGPKRWSRTQKSPAHIFSCTDYTNVTHFSSVREHWQHLGHFENSTPPQSENRFISISTTAQIAEPTLPDISWISLEYIQWRSCLQHVCSAHILRRATAKSLTEVRNIFYFNLLNAELNPSCKSQLAEFFWVGI